MHNSREKFIYRSPNEGLEEGSYKSKSTLKDGAERTITFAIAYRGRVFYQNWLQGRKKDGNWNASLVKATIPIIRRKIDVSFPSVVGKRIKLLLDNEGAQKTKENLHIWKDNKFDAVFQPTKSPDLNVLDFFLWSHVAKKYQGKIAGYISDNDDSDVEEEMKLDFDHLLELLEEALDETNQVQLVSAHNNLNKRIRKCIIRRGGRFENYIFNPAQKARMDAM